jgi:preprotein translocase subunit SecF
MTLNMKLNVIQQRTLWWGISMAAIAIGILAMLFSWQQLGAPLRPSLDFIGGTRLQIELVCARTESCDGPIDPADVRTILTDEGLEGSSIQVVGDQQNALSIRTTALDVDQRESLLQTLEAELGEIDPTLIQIDTVGPTLGRQIFVSGLTALGAAFLGIMFYLSIRFQPDYAAFALVAVLHDVLITLGFFAIAGLALRVEADSLFIVALLTIVGFSVNDTVVIYDRVRETLRVNPGMHINDIVDSAVNQTLTRSINTTFTTLLSLVAIFLFGGETLKYFALALIIGFLSGAYSSIFIASTLLAFWRERRGRAYAEVATDAEPADSAP